jgi:transcriptional regulator with XRE-family HTH domain
MTTPRPGGHRTPAAEPSSTPATAETPGAAQTTSLLRVRLGARIQEYRLRCGLTQSLLAELTDLSVKYVGEIERGEANPTLGTLERLADVVQWDPMQALDVKEPLTERVRLLLVSIASGINAQTDEMMRWLEALNPSLPASATPPVPMATRVPSRKRRAPRVSRRVEGR